MRTAIAGLSAGSCTAASAAGNAVVMLSPGTYSNMTFTASSIGMLSPGLYTVNGDVTFEGNTVVAGSGETIVPSGALNILNPATVTLTAPGASPTGGAISGFVFVNTGTGSLTLSGSVTPNLTGVPYAPNTSLSITGSAGTAVTTCLEFIVNNATVTGAASLGSGC